MGAHMQASSHVERMRDAEMSTPGPDAVTALSVMAELTFARVAFLPVSGVALPRRLALCRSIASRSRSA